MYFTILGSAKYSRHAFSTKFDLIESIIDKILHFQRKLRFIMDDILHLCTQMIE